MTDFEPSIYVGAGADKAAWKHEGPMVYGIEKSIVSHFSYRVWKDLPGESEIVLLPREDYDTMLDDLRGKIVSPRRRALLVKVSRASGKHSLTTRTGIILIAMIVINAAFIIEAAIKIIVGG